MSTAGAPNGNSPEMVNGPPAASVVSSTFTARVGEIVWHGELHANSSRSWRSIRTTEERLLVYAALSYSRALDSLFDADPPPPPDPLERAVLETPAERMLQVDERAIVSRAIDRLGSADPYVLAADPQFAGYVGYVAAAKYAQGYRLITPHQPSAA